MEPLGFVVCRDVTYGADAGTVDENVDAAESLGHLGDRMAYRVNIGDISSDLEMTAVSTGGSAQDRHTTTAFVKQLSSRSTNPAGAACN